MGGGGVLKHGSGSKGGGVVLGAGRSKGGSLPLHIPVLDIYVSALPSDLNRLDDQIILFL